MAFTEQNKRRLHARLCEVIGTEEADILMEQLPPFTWTDFVTKQNLEELRNSLKRDLKEQSVGLKHDIEFSAIATRTNLEQMITKSTFHRGCELKYRTCELKFGGLNGVFHFHD